MRDIQVIRAEWNNKMKLYEQKGYSLTEDLNMCTDEQKLSDIEFLKSQNCPGSFTRSNQVSDYLGSDHNDGIKNKRLYVEVRLVKKTCLSIKPSSSVFRLKRSGNYLTSDEYAKNLITYFEISHSQITITIAELHNVLLALHQEKFCNKQTTVNYPCFNLGDYVAAFWIDGNGKHEWFLASRNLQQ